jgi:hypothetical protein
VPAARLVAVDKLSAAAGGSTNEEYLTGSLAQPHVCIASS